MNYHVIFDASQSNSEIAIFWLGPLAAIIPGLIGWSLFRSSDPKEAAKGKFFLLIAFLGFCFSLVLLVGKYNEHFQSKNALRTGDYQIVEGTVENFVPMPPGGHSTESFEVNKIPFRYGNGRGSVVFNSEWNRGYIHNGVQARIAYKGENILRVEVR